jgi:hypothetical protein
MREKYEDYGGRINPFIHRVQAEKSAPENRRKLFPQHLPDLKVHKHEII